MAVRLGPWPKLISKESFWAFMLAEDDKNPMDCQKNKRKRSLQDWFKSCLLNQINRHALTYYGQIARRHGDLSWKSHSPGEDRRCSKTRTTQDQMNWPYYIPNCTACIISLQTGRRLLEVTCHHECHNLSVMMETAPSYNPFLKSSLKIKPTQCANWSLITHVPFSLINISESPLL